jgi:hypothetical protein
MISRPRKITTFLLAAVVAVAVSCTSGEPLGPSVPHRSTLGETKGRPSGLLAGGLPNDLSDLTLLSCSPQQYVSVSQVVGPDGGTIVVGTHALTIPAGALTKNYTIQAELVSGRVNSVRFSPEGLTFAKPATLSLSYANCSQPMVAKKVVYTDELLEILELLPSLDDSETGTVTGDIQHFSRYAVAW